MDIKTVPAGQRHRQRLRRLRAAGDRHDEPGDRRSQKQIVNGSRHADRSSSRRTTARCPPRPAPTRRRSAQVRAKIDTIVISARHPRQQPDLRAEQAPRVRAGAWRDSAASPRPNAVTDPTAALNDHGGGPEVQRQQRQLRRSRARQDHRPGDQHARAGRSRRTEQQRHDAQFAGRQSERQSPVSTRIDHRRQADVASSCQLASRSQLQPGQQRRLGRAGDQQLLHRQGRLRHRGEFNVDQISPRSSLRQRMATVRQPDRARDRGAGSATAGIPQRREPRPKLSVDGQRDLGAKCSAAKNNADAAQAISATRSRRSTIR